MKLKERNWTWPKLGLLAITLMLSLTGSTHEGNHHSEPPIWIAIIPVAFVSIFLPFYFGAAYENRPYPDRAWRRFPFSPFVDPLPFYQLVAIVCLIDFLGSQPRFFLEGKIEFESIFSASCGIGGLVGIAAFRRKRKIKRVGV